MSSYEEELVVWIFTLDLPHIITSIIDLTLYIKRVLKYSYHLLVHLFDELALLNSSYHATVDVGKKNHFLLSS